MKLSPVMEELFAWCKEHPVEYNSMPKRLYNRLAVLRCTKAGANKKNLTKFYKQYDEIAKQIGCPNLFDKPHKVTPQESYNKHAQPIEDKQQDKYLKDAQELVQWIKTNKRLPIPSLTDKTQNRLASFQRRLVKREHPFPDHKAFELAMPIIKQYKKRDFKQQMLLTWARTNPNRTDVPKHLKECLYHIRHRKNKAYLELVQINPNFKQ